MKRQMLLMCFLVLAFGCSDDDPASGNNSNPNNKNNVNNTNNINNTNNGDCTPSKGGIEVCDGVDNNCDGAIDEDFPTLGDTCSQGVGTCAEDGVYVCADDESGVVCNANTPTEPITSCPEDACGMVDDGCGDVLDCGVCPCVDGQPTSPTCGQCDLGAYICPSEHTGIGVCETPRGLETLTELDCATQVFYVDGAQPIGQEGTREEPSQGYSDVALKAEAGSVIVISTEEIVRVRIKDGVHVFGGYSPDTWVFDTNARTVVRALQSPLGDSIGFGATGINATTYVSNLEVIAADAIPGKSSIGAVISDSNGLSMSDSSVTSGIAGAGEAGEAGVEGDSATTAGNGGDSIRQMFVDTGNGGQDLLDCFNFAVLGTALGNFGGAGGSNASCPDANGGAGGAGQTTRSSGTDSNIQPGVASAGGATGGTPPALNNGGNVGSNGLIHLTPGTAGAAGLASFRIDNGITWVNEGGGAMGTAGSHGVGGGGGSGAWGQNSVGGITVGMSGGGGSAGGCGGTQGTGGTGGGASIGVLISSSNATFINMTFSGGAAGQGGDGGLGGTGGLGAVSGQSESGQCLYTYTAPGIGGAGGTGSAGQDGGSGGGGAGGASHGALCQTSTPSFEMVTFVSGTPGVGGNGGSNEPTGETGMSDKSLGCGQ